MSFGGIDGKLEAISVGERGLDDVIGDHDDGTQTDGTKVISTTRPPDTHRDFLRIIGNHDLKVDGPGNLLIRHFGEMAYSADADDPANDGSTTSHLGIGGV